MGKSTSTFNFKVPWALTYAILIVVLFECLVMCIPNPIWGSLSQYSNPLSGSAFNFWTGAKLSSEEDPTVFLIGSSQVREGIDPSLLAKLLSKGSGKTIEVRNVGISAGAMPEMLLQLDVLLERKPFLLVASPSPQRMGDPYDNFPRVADFSYSLSGASQILIDFWGVIGRQDLVTFASRSLLFNLYPSVRLVRSFSLPRYLIQRLKRWPVRSPYAYDKSLAFDRMLERFNEIGSPVLEEESKIHINLAEKFAKRVGKHDTKLVFVDFPFNPAMDAHFGGWKAVYVLQAKVLQRISNELGLAYLKRGQLPTFNKEDFIDTTHLNQRGRKKMTEHLANWILPVVSEEFDS